ncbi:C45 family autoproteolytic acyltransferase/hydolase [Burkholderia gladioli]|uniref:C45 family autoproteolytic acyltransferase/hydolase n=1 Tax=Burkholderia gladioli TaxID=28095 RepID=UPI0034DB47C4
MSRLTPSVISGSPYEIGFGLGVLARPIINAYMNQSAAWKAVSQWQGSVYVRNLRRIAEDAFPDAITELDGMAEGMGWTKEDAFLWNCRGELIHNAPDGCTTLAARSSRGHFVAHNEDGDPYLRGKCSLVDIRPSGKPGFVSFYYPGSLPGHTFAVNRAGVVQAINNLRIKHPQVGVPRMVLCRAVLDTSSLDNAIHVLSHHARASGFHHTLACVGDERLLSVEATVARCSIENVERLAGHANHLIHRESDAEEQLVTDSSRERQVRLRQLLPAMDEVNEVALLHVLRDKASPTLPIYRTDPADPDDENTLATALFAINEAGVELKVHQEGEESFKHFVLRETNVKASS